MVSFSSSTLLALAALAGVAAAADRKCTPEHPKVSITGNGYDASDVASSAVCGAKCLADASCAAYIYADNLCILYNSFLRESYTPTESNSFVSARCMKTSDVRMLLTPLQNVDFPGLDIGSAYAATANDCGAVCQDTPGCFAYSWNNYNGGSCWMKSGKPATVTPTDGSVVSGQVFTCSTPHFDSDAVGTDLASVLRADPIDCCGVCRSTAGCVGYSWNNYNGGTCWLKSSISGFTNNPGVLAAVL